MTESSFEVLENIILLGHKGAYFVERFLGEGTFGKVAKCTNLSTNKEVAIKIIKNGFNDTAKDEIKALTEISKLDAHKYSLVKFVEWFHYNSHVCIVFEMLDQSLFDFMKDRSSLPLFLHEIRAIAWQLLISLKGLKSINLVHCDIKLDNIMLVNQVSEPFRVKLIDFGLASKTTDIQTGTRLQNICFRAPEVILGLPLDERLDMWTVGYVLALLYTGFYILPRDSEFNIIRAMVEMQGMPDNECLNQGLYTYKFFTQTEENSKVVWKLDTPEQRSKKSGEQVKDKLDCWSFDDLKDVYYDQTKIKEVEQLIDLLKRMLEVDPNKRISPNDALRHPFFDLEKKTPKISKPQEPAAVEVHQQTAAKEVPSVPKGPTANPQETSSNKNKKSLVQQKKAEKRKAPAASRKRTNSDRQSQDPEKSWQMEAAVKKKRKS
ncbi:homeodomain-interacting protein kinase 1-like [Oryzias latipes]|uniref:homeodomain-interacting protein kinase 1-like n=1 Tax=Oryzias latipes TaxID=8090 RepID=UPI000CE22312|nr:homeodomain-interacting protein kinase 1-like [Oryzias latipes]